jgi:hypothetical protein
MSVTLRKAFESFLTNAFGLDPSIWTDFEFIVGTTPLSNIYFPLITITLYCIGIPSLQSLMKNRSEPSLKLILIVHNLLLSVASLFLALFLIIAVLSVKAERNYTALQTFCAMNHYDQQGTLTLIYYVNYLFKYYELLDTIFLALKHKNIGFLHAYHHPATLVLTWVQLVDSTGVQYVVILLNLIVHTVMYFYYAMNALKVRMPWKRLVTLLQILQFVIDLIACYSAWAMFAFYGTTFSTPRAAIVGCFILTSYLYLFVDFYQMTYNKVGDRKLKKQTQELVDTMTKKDL